MSGTRSLLDGTAAPILIGMVHLRPLPGSPRYAGDIAAVEGAALRDAEALAEAGFDALMVENFFDSPFFPDRVDVETVAAMSRVCAALRRASSLPLGINVLRNDGLSALAVAAAVDAAMVRVNVLTGARLGDQGILHGMAHRLLRRRRELGAEHVRILADVDVKHSAPLAPLDPEQEVEDLVQRGGADALIVSGTGTGKSIDAGALERVRRAAADVPLLAGSGVSVATLPQLAARVDGFIVGTSLKRDGRVEAPVDVDRARELVAAARRCR